MTELGLRMIAAIVARLPRSTIAPLGALLGFLAGSVLRIRRSLVEAAIARAFEDQAKQHHRRHRRPNSHSSLSADVVARRMYRSLGRGLFELLWLAGAARRKKEEMIARVTIDRDAVDALDEGLARGPVIFFASHTGNWELMAAAAAALLEKRGGRRLVVVAKTIRARGIDAFVARLRSALGVRTIAPHGAFKAAREALRAGDVVVMPIDQVPDRASHGITRPFLGADALIDRAPATLAWRAKATVLVVASSSLDHRGEHRVRLLATLTPPPASKSSSGSAATTWIEHATTTATSRLSDFILREPSSWLWLHRRWRAPKESSRASVGARVRARARARAQLPMGRPLSSSS